MESAGVEKLLPADVRIRRIFTAPEVVSGAVVLPGWDDAGMRLCKMRSLGRAVRGNGVFFKEYIYRSPGRRFRRRFEVPRPFAALDAALRLERTGIPTPKVLAAVHGVAPDGTIYDLLVTAELADSAVFGDVFFAAPERDGGPEEIAETLVPVAYRMHEGGVFHGDLSLRNWYLTSDGAWGLIDLDGAHSVRRVTRFRRTLELARLASSCFVVRTVPEDDAAALRRAAAPFLEAYRRCGGGVFRALFYWKARKLADRFRRKYLKMGKLK